MKLNSTVVLTLVLLVMMVGAGIASAAGGFALGREALKGITQPDVRPGNLNDRQRSQPHREAVTILKEENILKNVRTRIGGNPGEINSAETKRSSAGNKSLVPVANTQTEFPIVSQDRGVVLEVESTHRQNGNLILDVRLRNDGARTLRFLYSFLNVTDEQGRSLNANAEGLPGELPPYSETFKGTVSIPAALLDNSQKLSLSLTDYPEQRLQLQMSNIPVVR